MIASELHPIPEGSVITEDMLDAWIKFYGIADEEGQRAGVLGTLVALENNTGLFPGEMLEVSGNGEVFEPLLKALRNEAPSDEVVPAEVVNVEVTEDQPEEVAAEEEVVEASEVVVEEASEVVEEAPEEVEGVEEVEVSEGEDEKLPSSDDSTT